jgi:hypothetical protein
MAVQAMGTQIRIPQGDTGSVKFTYAKGEVSADDRALFTVANQNGGAMLRKVLTPNDSDLAFHLPFTYGETASMKPGSYNWSLRVVRDGTLDVNGRITDVQGSHTAVLNGRLTILPVAGGAK